MDVIVIGYLVVSVVAVVIGYALVRAIDFGFTKAEDVRRHKFRKDEIKCYHKAQGRMAMDVTKSINDKMLEMFKNMGDL
jgi:type III secretory pathway component EscU